MKRTMIWILVVFAVVCLMAITSCTSSGGGGAGGDGGGLMCDSPHLLERILSTYEDLGLKTLLTEYFGERP